MNLAPVKDFCVVEEDGGGSVSQLSCFDTTKVSWDDADMQSHLVVASGASNANSLRIVKSGASLEHLVHLEGIEGVERVWSLDHDR
jgi:DNA damage-binding protein 1